MNFKQVETFRAVMLSRSMTLAAARLHTSQPNVSRVISQLERETGMALFQRTGSRLVPTLEGEALFKEVTRAFVGLDHLRESARSIRQLGAGALRIGVVPAIAMTVMAAAISQFRRHYSEVPISVYTSDSRTVANWTATRFCDFGLVAYLVDVPGIRSARWRNGRGLCIMPVGHRLARRRRIAAKDLDGEDFISLTQGDGTRVAIDAAFEAGARRLIIETPYAATICSMVGMGLGVSIVNPLVVRSLRPPGIVSLPFDPAIPFPSYILHAEQHLESTHARVFFECLQEVARQR